MQAQTVRSAFERRGPGVHTGRDGWIRVEPAPQHAGLSAILADGSPFPIDLAHARAGAGFTALTDGEHELLTPEHLLAALVGAGVTDARIVATGPEVPVMDGSSMAWTEAIAAVGLRSLGELVPRVLVDPIRVELGGGVAEAWPAALPSVEVVVDFGARGPSGALGIVLDGQAFAREISWARTFALADEVPALLAAGRGKGATAENTVIWDGQVARNGARSADEAVRHKLLDLIGDLALVGRPVCARIRVTRGSHALHHALVSELRACGPPPTRSG